MHGAGPQPENFLAAGRFRGVRGRVRSQSGSLARRLFRLCAPSGHCRVAAQRQHGPQVPVRREF